MNFPLPLILGLEEQLEGSLLEYLNNRGLVTLGIEAGQHDAPASVQHFIAAVWLGMVHAGMLEAAALPALNEHRGLLSEAAAGKPRVVEVRYRFAITPADDFRMQPGYRNFHQVRKGELLAQDRDGDIRAILDGMVLLPLYQGQGDDGFFLATEFRPFWLKVSGVLRRLRTAALLPLCPGVRQHPDREGVLIVDTRVARWFPLQIFRLVGYRKLRRRGKLLLVSRRKFDLRAPVRYSA
jgi:succinylglutamate desuccinylase